MARRERTRTRTRRTTWAVVAVVVLVAAAVGAWVLTHRAATPSASAATTQLVAASTQTVKQTVSSTGTIQPAQQTNLKFAQAGTVTAVSVKVGDTVTAGQPLGALDPTTLNAAVTLAQQQLTAANAQLTAATTAANATQIASANAQVTSAQTKLTTAQTALSQATLTSAIAGTVASVNVNVGDTVTGGTSSSGSSGSSGISGSSGGSGGSAAGASGGSGAAVVGNSAATSASAAQFVVISTASWLVNATVGASDLPQLRSGMQATITPTGATQAIFGTVSTVGIIGTTSGSTSTFPVAIAVTGSPTGLYAGTTAAVVITVKQVPDVLTVPTAAIHNESGQTVVYQMKDGAQVSTPVTVGAVYGATTQITKGLTDGEEVVVAARTGRTPNGATTGGTGGGFGGAGLGGGGTGGGTRQGAPAAPPAGGNG